MAANGSENLNGRDVRPAWCEPDEMLARTRDLLEQSGHRLMRSALSIQSAAHALSRATDRLRHSRDCLRNTSVRL